MRAWLVLLAAAGLWCCERGVDPGNGEDPGPEPSDDGVAVTFADSSLEQAVREALGDTAGVLTVAQVRTLTQLDASDRGIEELGGVEHLTALAFLDLSYNSIDDIAALAGLDSLVALNLGYCGVRDLSPLRELSALRVLILDGNEVSDLAPLEGLYELEAVGLCGAQLVGAQTEAQVAVLQARGVEVDLGPTGTEEPQQCQGPTVELASDLHFGMAVVPQALGEVAGRCFELAGDLTVEASGLVVLDTLAGMEAIQGSLVISDNPYLESVDLSRLERADSDVRVSGNADLVALLLQSLKQVGGYLEISDNAELASLEWLSSLESVGGIGIYGNHRLPASEADELVARLLERGIEGRVDVRNNQAPGARGPGPLAFASDREGQYDIYAMDTHGVEVTRLTTNPLTERHPSWAPDGTRIVFERGEASADLVVVDVGDGSETALTQGDGDCRDPAWSPDGTRIALVRSTPDRSIGDLYLMRADGTGLEEQTRFPNSVSDPSWSPDGQRLAFTSRGWDLPTSTIFTLHVPTGVVTQVGDGAADERSPSWSPDGTELLYSLDSNPAPNGYSYTIWALALEVGERRKLTDQYDMGPAWGPAGEQMVFSRLGVSSAGVQIDVYLSAIDGTGEVNVTDHSGDDRDPDWWRDGS